MPFAAALEPWREAALTRLAAAAPAAATVLGPDAHRGLIEGLDDELATAAAPTLLDGFHRSPTRRHFTRATDIDYRSYAALLGDQGLVASTGHAPELFAVLDQIVDDWTARAAALVERLEADRPVLAERFGLTLPVASARCIVRTAIELGDDAGPIVVYKSRPVAMDRAFGDLVGWLDERLGEGLHVVDIVERDGWGWTGFVPHRPTDGPAGRSAFAVRTGVLLCVAHLLGGGDLHAANIRSAGAHPVVVDAEVLLRPRRAGVDDRDGPGPTVASTGWLPVPGDIDRCGLAAESYRGRASAWVDVGTDAVRPRSQPHTRGRMRPEIIARWADDADTLIAGVCQGFERAHALVRREGLPLDLFADTNPRVLLRPSQRYGAGIDRSLTPARLRSAASRERAFDWADDDVPPSLVGHPGVACRAAAAERAFMRNLENPRFTTPATGRTLCWGAEPLGTPFDESPLDRAARFVSLADRTAAQAQSRTIADTITAAISGSLDAVGVRFERLDPASW